MADAKPARRKRAKKAPEPRGLTAKQVPGAEPPRKVAELTEAIVEDGGSVIGTYREAARRAVAGTGSTAN